MWILFAAGSALFAGVTAILAKCGIRKTDSTVATAIRTIVEAEPFGPQNLADVLVIAPCTGNTLAKLAHGITDGPVTMAAKSHLRNGKPVVVALATNDGLSASAPNLAALLNRKNYYFVPFGQDDPQGKPTSLIADFSQLVPTIDAALRGVQLQPLLVK